MLTRRKFLTGLILLPVADTFAKDLTETLFQDDPKDFSKRLKPLGRALELPDWYVWGSSPVYGPDKKVHLFYTRWPANKQMGGLDNGAEIAHAVAASPEAPFEHVETVLAPRGSGHWDGMTCNNPHIQFLDGKYYLFYTGNADGQTSTQRIGLATAKSLEGPWKRSDTPLLEPGPSGSWDDHCTTNPAFVQHPNGEYWLYYESWKTDPSGANAIIRKYGLSIADFPTGPYQKFGKKPVIDFATRTHKAQIDDAFIWLQSGRFNLLARDMGLFNQNGGVFLDSHDGINWFDPQIAYATVNKYVNEPAATGQIQSGRLERPQLLLRKGKPAYLFTATQGGKYGTSSTFVFRVELPKHLKQ